MERTLASLATAELPPSYAGVLVVENGERGGASRVVAACPPSIRAEYLHIPRRGKCAALNAAVGRTSGSLVVFADDDVRFDRGTLVAYAAAAQQDPSGAYFGGPFGVDCEVPPPDWLRDYLPASAVGWELADGREGHTFIGFNWAAFADDILAAGGFCERIGPGAQTGCSVGDETELQRRLRARGLRGRYVPEARVFHFVPPERCSPEWAIERAYRSGIASAMLRSLARKRVLGYPPWLVRRAAADALRVAYATLFGDAHTSYAARFAWAKSRGRLVGTARRRAGESQCDNHL
ncbi:MAG: glycosyltransferase family 2 protein [Acidobacteria bacterium]|nr:glycosyltransferase family 2 protein [Acidobacteriota bacterium]